MEQDLKFKTTINCGGCVQKVTPLLDAAAGKENWQVNTDHPQKILTVQTGEEQADAIVSAVKKAGFTIERL